MALSAAESVRDAELRARLQFDCLDVDRKRPVPQLYPMFARPEGDSSQRRTDSLSRPVHENLRPGQGDDIERGIAGSRDCCDNLRFAQPRRRRYFLVLEPCAGLVHSRRLQRRTGFGGRDCVPPPAWRSRLRGLRRRFRLFHLRRRGFRRLDLGRPDPGRCRRWRSEEHTSELQSRFELVCRLLLEKKKEGSVLSTMSTTSWIRPSLRAALTTS